MVEFTINWARCIHVDDVIDEALLRKLAPRILSLRQESRAPITVAINSTGGSLAIVDSLLKLLTGPDQDGNEGTIVTVVIQSAFSAAANLLASGFYAVALPNSEILFHDVRYGGIEDVTPSVARIAANELQKANAEFSLRLANIIFRRLVWNYMDLMKLFESEKEKFRTVYENYAKVCSICHKQEGPARVDLAGFATTLFANLSSKNDSLVANAMYRLGRWGGLTSLSSAIPNFKSGKSSIPGLLDGAKHLHGLLRRASKCDDGDAVWARRESELKLFITLIVDQLSDEKERDKFRFTDAIERATESFLLIDSINDEKQIKMATRKLLRYKHIFFSQDVLTQLENGDDEVRAKILENGVPVARLFWHFCVLLCEELFDGEHKMSPAEAQILGLVDEVIGGGPVESRRDFRRRRSEQEE